MSDTQDRLNRSELEHHGKRLSELEENREHLVSLVRDMIERLEIIEREISTMKRALEDLLTR
jgi:hypothetical protein